MTMLAIIPESSIEKDVLMAFPPENEASSIRVAFVPQSDPLLEFSTEDRTPVGPETDARMAFLPENEASSIRVTSLPQSDPLREFSPAVDRASRASSAGRAFTSQLARDGRLCLTWLSTCQADLKVGLYELAGFIAVALGVRSHSINQRLRLGLSFARATMSALAMRESVFTSTVARERRRCLMWLSTCQADLKVGLYEIKGALYEIKGGLYEVKGGLYEVKGGLHEVKVGLYEMAGSLAAAVRARSHSTNRRLKLVLCSARATLNAIVMGGSAFTSRPTPYTRRALIPVVSGVAAAVVVTLFLPAQSIPGATMRSVVPSVPPPANARSVGAGIQQTVTTAGRRESDPTSAVSSSRPSVASPRNAPSGQRAASPKLAKYRGSLAVNSAPKGATVLVNGVPVGTTPLLLKDLPVGSRVVRLELDGYERWSSAVRVVANQRVLTSVDLQPSSSNN